MTSIPDCSTLADLDAFPEYIELLRNETAFNPPLLAYCQSDICSALWGIGNPDVSGVGVRTFSAKTWNTDLLTIDDNWVLFREHPGFSVSSRLSRRSKDSREEALLGFDQGAFLEGICCIL